MDVIEHRRRSDGPSSLGNLGCQPDSYLEDWSEPVTRRIVYGFGAGGAGAGLAGAGVVAGAGVTGAGVAGFVAAGGAGTEPMTDPGPRVLTIDRASAPAKNRLALTQVTLVSRVAPVRAPKAAWLLPPPNAEAMSPALPCWIKMTSSSTRQFSTKMVATR
jgi:hypothetical protein